MRVPVMVITGGSRGIGEAVALRAARLGYFVVLTYVASADRASSVVERIRTAGGNAAAIQADTAEEADIQRVFVEADKHGTLSVLVYNSGVTGQHSALIEAETSTIDRVLDVNLRGAILCGREAARRMSTRMGGRGGAIVFVSSRAAFYGSPAEFVWYAASKGGMDSLTNGLARELGAEGVRVNAVSPGPIETEMHRPGKLEVGARRAPMQRAGSPDEVAATILFLASSEASYVTGANLAVSGGL